MMRGTRQRGITFLELVVTIFVGGILTLFLVPALQDARAAARRASCIDNLKQMGVALFNYQSAWNVLPMSQVRGEGHANGHSVFSIILPFLNEAPLFNSYNFHLENWHTANATSVQTQVSTYPCPDNPSIDNVPASELNLEGAESRSTFAKSHYGANLGGDRDRWGQDFVKQKGTYTGVMMTVIMPDGQKEGPDGSTHRRQGRSG